MKQFILKLIERLAVYLGESPRVELKNRIAYLTSIVSKDDLITAAVRRDLKRQLADVQHQRSRLDQREVANTQRTLEIHEAAEMVVEWSNIGLQLETQYKAADVSNRQLLKSLSQANFDRDKVYDQNRNLNKRVDMLEERCKFMVNTLERNGIKVTECGVEFN